MRAGLIHAYLKGNCIEAMANSDNVVRCGFTPKFKDIQTMNEVTNIQIFWSLAVKWWHLHTYNQILKKMTIIF